MSTPAAHFEKALQTPAHTKSNRGSHDEDVQVVHGDRDLAQLAVVPAGHEKDVEAFLQNSIPSKF